MIRVKREKLLLLCGKYYDRPGTRENNVVWESVCETNKVSNAVGCVERIYNGEASGSLVAPIY